MNKGNVLKGGEESKVIDAKAIKTRRSKMEAMTEEQRAQFRDDEARE